MKKIGLMAGLAFFGCNLHAMDSDDFRVAIPDADKYAAEYMDLAEKFFPVIHDAVSNCANHWDNDQFVKREDRRFMEEGYLKEAKNALDGNNAPNLKRSFEALASCYKVPSAVIFKLFGCARYVTGKTDDGRNLFVEANKLLLQFTPQMLDLFHKNIDQIRESFAGDATERDGKISNIMAHIQDLMLMREMAQNGAHVAFKNNNNDAIINYINFIVEPEQQKLAIEFALLGAQSSLAIVKEFVPPNYWDLFRMGTWNYGTLALSKVKGLFYYFD